MTEPELPSTIPALPFRMRNVEILTVAYRTTPGASARFVPAPLRALGERVLLHFYNIHDAGPYGAYTELAVHIPVEHPRSGTQGGFSPMIFLESDSAIATGREVYGQPKKLASISLSMVGDLVVGRASRNGLEFCTATTPARQKASSAEVLSTVMLGTNLNLKVIPAVDGSGDEVRQLTARDFADVEIHEVWEGFGTVDLRPHAQAPVHLLPVVAVEMALHWRADFTATSGRVLENLIPSPVSIPN